MAVDIRWLFNNELPGRCEAAPASVCSLGATYQLVVTGRDGGEWFIDLRDDAPPSIREGVGEEEADCTVVMSSADFQRYFANPLMNGMTLYMQGRIKALGDPALFNKLGRLFTLPRY